MTLLGPTIIFQKQQFKKKKVGSLQNPSFMDTVFGRREIRHEDIYCRIRRTKWTVTAVSPSHEISRSTTKAWMSKASKGFPPGAADHAGMTTHLIKGLNKFREGQSGWSIPSSWQECCVQNRFLCTVQKYVESIFHKKSGMVQKVIQGWGRRKGSKEERNEMEVNSWAWVSQSLWAELGAICWKGRRGRVRRGTSESLSHGISWGMGSFPYKTQSLRKNTREGASSPAAMDWSRDAGAAPCSTLPKLPRSKGMRTGHAPFSRMPPFTAQHFNRNPLILIFTYHTVNGSHSETATPLVQLLLLGPSPLRESSSVGCW